MKEYKIEDIIRVKMVKYGKDLANYLTTEESKIVMAIMNSLIKPNEKISSSLRKEYPNLYFVLKIMYIEAEGNRKIDSLSKN